MALSSGKYYVGDPRVKPDQWGPAADVQAAIRENAAGMGIDPDLIYGYYPAWEKAGNQMYNYVRKNHDIGINNNTWDKSGISITSPFVLDSPNPGFWHDEIITLTMIFRASLNIDSKVQLIQVGADNGFRIEYGPNNDVLSFITSINNIEDYVPINDIVAPFDMCNISITYDAGAKSIFLNRSFASSAHGSSIPEHTWQPDFCDDWRGRLDHCFFSSQVLSQNQVFYLHDNPYALIQPIVRRFYSIPNGAGDVISAACTDGFTFADSATKTAILQAAAIESINLSDSDENVAQFISALVDSFAIADLSGNTAKYPVSVSDAFSVSDTTTAMQKVIALVSDNVTFSDVSIVRADLTGIAEDNVQFSETLLAALQAQAIVTEIINLSDSVNAELLGNLLAYVTETFNMSDSTTARADLVTLITDAFNLSDAATNTLQAYATAEDGFTVSATAFWAGVTQAIVSDSFTVSGSLTGLIKLLAQAAETINFSDSGSVTATYNVQVNDAVEFATAISTIAQFRAAVADGFNVTATPMEVSQLPNGKVSVSFSMKTATVIFNIK